MSNVTALQPTVPAGAATPDPKLRRLDHAAQQFEAMLLQEMLKPLSQHEDAGSGDDTSKPGPMESFGIEAIAGSLARSGVLGFASSIKSALQHGPHAASPKSASSLLSEKI